LDASLRPSSSRPTPISIAVDASRCSVRLGDRVAPETVLGTHPATGETVTAGHHGEVVAIHFAGAEHTLVVVLQPADA
jgi:hypothetical protein